MGSTRIIISVAIEKPAFAYQLLVILMHVPGTDLSQALLIGVHCHIDEAAVASI